ncbi:flagellar associated repeat protein, partial [Azospirillum brasilense]
MAAGGTLTLTGGTDYVFSTTEVWSGIRGNGSTQGVRLNTQGQTLSVSNLDRLIGGTSSTRKDVVTLAGTAGNTITVQALETLIGGSGNDRVLLTSTGATMVVESLETILGANTGTALITLAGTTGNTMSVGYLKSMVGSAGKDVININAAGSVGSTMAVALMETMIGTDGLDLIATIGGTGSNTMLVKGIEIFLGNSSVAVNDVVHLDSGGNTIGIAFLETLMGGSGNDVVTMSFKSGSANLQSTAGTLAVSSIETIVGGTGGRNTAILLDVGNTITVASLNTLIGGGGKDVVNVTLRDGTAVVGDGSIPWSTTGSTMLVSLIETIIGSAGDDVVVALDNNGMTLSVSAIESVVGKTGNDVVVLGTGGNTIQVEALETLIGSAGTDVVTVRTSLGTTMTVSAVESIVGNAGTDVIQLGAGGNTIQVEGVETVIGGTGTDVVTVTETTGTIFLSGVETIYTPYQTLTLSGVDTSVSWPPAPSDTTPPSITAVSIPDAVMKIGDTVTVTITVASDSDTYTLGVNSTVGGFTLGNLTKVDATTYTATFTVTSGGTDVAAGSDVPVNIVLTDSASNSNIPYTTAISQGADRIDATRPTIASAAVNGTTLTVTFGEAMSASSAAGLTVTVAGQSRAATYASGSGTATLTFTLASAVAHGETVTLDYNPGTGTLTDTASNAPASITNQSVTNSTAAPDTTPPSITAVSIPDAVMKIGDTVTVTITVASDSDTYTLGSGSTVGGFALGNLTKVNATTYTATFTVTSGGTDVAAGSDVPVNIVLTDSASNSNTPYTTPISQTNDRIDATRPTIASATVNGTTLTVTFAEAMSASSAAGLTVTVAGQSRAATYASGSGTATLTFTLASAVAQGQTVTLDYNPGTGTLTDTASNAPASVSNQSVTNNTADTTPPSITNVTIPNQPAQVGDTVTVTITVASDSDTYTLGSGSTVDGFALGSLTKVSATTYTATFTVTADGNRTGNLAANQDIPVHIVLVDSASNANAPYTTPISQANDRIDTNAPPVLAVPTTPPTLVDTSATDTFPLIDGRLTATDMEGDTLTFSIAGSQSSPLQYGSVTLSNGVTYDTWSTGPGGTAYVNSQTGHYAYVFDAAFLNGVPAGPMQGTSTFTVSDGNRTVSQQLTLNFTGANDSPILSSDVRGLAAIDQGIADAANTGTTVTDLLASAGTATDAEYDSPFPLVTVVPLGIAVTGVINTNGTWQYKVGTGAWTDIPAGSSNGSALLLAGSDRLRFVPSGSGFANTDTGAITFKAWDRTSGTAGSTADTSGDAFSAGGATATITVDAVPTLAATGGAKTFGVGVDASTSLFSGVAASTVEAGQSFRGAVFTVSGLVDATEVLTIGGTDVALTNGATATLTGLGAAGGNAGVTVSVTGGVATVTVTGLERSDAQMSALLGGVTYKNTSATATLGDRTVAIAGLTDSGGATGAATISGVSAVVSVADVTPPAAPVVTSAALTKNATPVLAGTAESGSTVTVTVGGATYTTTATNGTWSVNLATATPTSGSLSLNANGTNAISATATDAAGNTSTAGTQSLTIDTTAPTAPAVTSAVLTKNATPTLTGTAEADSTVTVTVGGATYTTTATNGTWSINLATATPTAGSLSLNANGANPVSATATDAAGNTSSAGTQSLTIDTTAPTAPAVTSAVLTKNATPTLTGTAEADSTVTVTVGGATYTTTATNGTWSINLATATPTAGSLNLNANGANPVSATATDAAGNTSSAGTQSLTIDTTAPTAPAVTSAVLTKNATPT